VFHDFRSENAIELRVSKRERFNIRDANIRIWDTLPGIPDQDWRKVDSRELETRIQQPKFVQQGTMTATEVSDSGSGFEVGAHVADAAPMELTGHEEMLG
jgi:hypothetical protein